MKFIKILLAAVILTGLNFGHANAISCSYEVLGGDLSERGFALLFEDSYERKTLSSLTSPEGCIDTAVGALKKYKYVAYQIKGKTFYYQPEDLHVVIQIGNSETVNLKIDELNQKIEGTDGLRIIEAFEYTKPYKAVIGIQS